MGTMMCAHCHGISKIIFGALLLLNGFVWPEWLGVDGWVSWIAVLMVLGGIMMLVMPNKCQRCAAMQGMTPEKGKKK